jgi:Na+-transporting NADH:ubiquinone oxidoreductase subunit C
MIFNLPNDDTRKVIAVALSLCLVCALVVSTAAVYLRPLQEVNKTLDMKKNILDVAGLMQPGTDINKVFAERIEIRVVDFDTGEFTDVVDPATYDQKLAARNPAMSEELARDVDVASVKRRANYASVYLLKDGDTLKQLILPVHGYGLWSTMYGFVALEPDLNTVAGIKFYQHGETPGLGGEIDNPAWQAKWLGKQLRDANGNVGLGVIKGVVITGNPNEQYQIDGLSGATLTGNGVSNMLQFWLGENGFGPFLDQLAESGV